MPSRTMLGLGGGANTTMDSYLELARDVLEESRRPLTPREILREAYSLGVVPAHLYGATQHKTLQARLSEHILDFRDNALFYRTAPGRFFLAKFLNDETIPEEFRKPIIARRRVRELRRKEVLAIPRGCLPDKTQAGMQLPADALQASFRACTYHYAPDLAARGPCDVLVWSFVVVLREKEVLTYRQGRYREDRDSFLQRRSIGFFAPVVKSDRGLFDQHDHGILSSGLETLAVDLDMSGDAAWHEIAADASVQSIVYAETGQRADLLGVVRINCPNWFEPLTRRLAINDLSWHDLSVPTNHFDDYDPWSQIVLQQAQSWVKGYLELNGSNRAWSN